MELFRGYVPTRNKQCLEKFKGVEKLKTRSEVQDLDEYAGILGEETILIDVDDAETSELLFRMVQDLELKCRVYATTRGKHFLFKNCGVKKSWTKCTLAVGITTDGKVGANNSYEILKSGGVERPILYDFPEGEIQELPKWLTPVKSNYDFPNLGEGDGRNQTLFNYILTLQSDDFTKEEARECIRLINRYVLKKPLSDKELDVILRDDAFKKTSFFRDKTFLFDKFATYLKNNNHIPLIRRVKTLQDGINTMISDFENNMQEDARNTILILKNYDGENLGEFRRNLATFGAVKVRDDGDVTTLTVEVNSENYKAILDVFKKALIENARGYDAKDDRLGGNPNQMNIQSMYSDIDLDANGMETEFQAAFEELLWFINNHFSNTGVGDFTDDVAIVFNRDILINESESIENCSKSVGILSNETIVEQHPWVTDVEAEMARLQKEKEEAMAQAQEYAGAFQTGNPNQGDNGGGE